MSRRIGLRWEAVRTTAAKLEVRTSDIVTKTRLRLPKIGTEVPGQDSLRHHVPDTAGKLSASRQSKATIFMADTAPSRQSSQCPGPIVPSLYSVRVSVSSLVWLGDK